MQRRVLVVGTRPNSLGDAIATAVHNSDELVMRADHPADSNDKTYPCDVTDHIKVRNMINVLRPTDVVCCVGINVADEPGNWIPMYVQSMVNYMGPMLVLEEFVRYWEEVDEYTGPTGLNFVAISSNSAHVPRSQSSAYCASKAALSMALRCVARRHGGRDGVCIWGYEPGWINGTPMSEEVADRLGDAYDPPSGILPHNIPGGDGLDKWALADHIWHDLQHVTHSFNGCMFRIDGGDK